MPSSYRERQQVPYRLQAEGSASKGEGGEEECAICQDEFSGGQRVAVLPCRHAFHEACIHKWLLRRATCPM